MPNPEIPYLAAGAVSIVGGAMAEKKWPSDANRAVVGTVVLVAVASASTNTRFSPLVHAVGLLLLLTAVMAAIRRVKGIGNSVPPIGRVTTPAVVKVGKILKRNGSNG